MDNFKRTEGTEKKKVSGRIIYPKVHRQNGCECTRQRLLGASLPSILVYSTTAKIVSPPVRPSARADRVARQRQDVEQQLTTYILDGGRSKGDVCRDPPQTDSTLNGYSFLSTMRTENDHTARIRTICATKSKIRAEDDLTQHHTNCYCCTKRIY